MSPLLVAALFAILGAGLVGTSVACVVLWRRVHALTMARSKSEPSAAADGSPTVAVNLPKGPARSRTDEWTRRFEELLGKHRGLEARLSQVEASAKGSMAPRPDGSRSARRSDPGRLGTSVGPTLISVPDLTAPPGSNAEAAAELDRRYGPVWAMAEEGMAVVAIARETGYPTGQVELILGLRRRLLGAEAGLDA